MNPPTTTESPEDCIARIEETLDFGMVDLAEKSLSIHSVRLAAPEFEARLARIRQRITEGRSHELEHGEGSLVRHDLPEVQQLLHFLKIAPTL